MSVGISSRKCWPQIIFFLVQMDVHVQHQGNLDHVFTTLNVPYYRTINGVWWLSGCPSQTSMQKRWHDSTTANEMKSFSVRSTPHDMTVAMGNNNSSCRMKPSYIRFFPFSLFLQACFTCTFPTWGNAGVGCYGNTVRCRAMLWSLRP